MLRCHCTSFYSKLSNSLFMHDMGMVWSDQRWHKLVSYINTFSPTTKQIFQSLSLGGGGGACNSQVSVYTPRILRGCSVESHILQKRKKESGKQFVCHYGADLWRTIWPNTSHRWPNLPNLVVAKCSRLNHRAHPQSDSMKNRSYKFSLKNGLINSIVYALEYTNQSLLINLPMTNQ